MSLGIIEGIGALASAEFLAIRSPKNVPLHVKLCKRLGAGFVAMSDDEIIAKVLAETNMPELQACGRNFCSDLHLALQFENPSGAMMNPDNNFQDPVHTDCNGLAPTGSSLYTNAEMAIPGLNTITANPIGRQLTSRAISAIPEVGGELNFALTSSPRSLVGPQTGGFVSNIGQQIGSKTLGQVGKVAGPILAGASIVMGFTQDGVAAGIANTLTTVAYFDPEPISRVILTIVGSVLGFIFGRHAARARLEHRIECIANQDVAEALWSIDAAVMAGNIFPEHGCQLLDHLFTSYKENLDKYGLVGRGNSDWGCNAGCEVLWFLTAVIIKKKDRFLHLVDAPCPPPPKVKIQARPQVYINPVVLAKQELAMEHLGRFGRESFL